MVGGGSLQIKVNETFLPGIIFVQRCWSQLEKDKRSCCTFQMVSYEQDCHFYLGTKIFPISLHLNISLFIGNTSTGQLILVRIEWIQFMSALIQQTSVRSNCDNIVVV